MLGGFIRVQSTWAISLEHVSVGNVFAVGAKPLNNDIIRIQTNSGSGHPSGAVRIINYHREAHTEVGQFAYAANSASPCVFTIPSYDINAASTFAFVNNEAVTLSGGTPPQPQANFSNGPTYWVLNATKKTFMSAKAISEFAYTATFASPCVFTAPGSGFQNNDAVSLSGTWSQMQTNFSNGTTYWVVNASGTTFQLAAAPGGSPISSTTTGSGNVIGGTPMNSTSTGSGTVTSVANDIFISDDTTQVYIETPNAVDPDTHPIQISLGAAPFAANVQMMNLPSNAVILGQNDQTDQPGNKTIVIGNGQITIGGTPIT